MMNGNNREETSVGIVLAILALLMGLVGAFALLSALMGEKPPVERLLGIYGALAILGGGVTFWWMSSIVDYIAEIAHNGRNKSTAQTTGKIAASQKLRDNKEEPPSYVLK